MSRNSTNTYQFDGNKSEVECWCSEDKIRVKVAFDTELFPLVSKFTWQVHHNVDGHWAARSRSKGRWVYMHRLVLGVTDPKVQIDHIEPRLPLDNRKSNLRIATNSQNQANTYKHRRNTTGFKGVTHKAGKYQAGVKLNGRYYYLGLHDDPATAAKAYDKKAVELHGCFARVNFPDADGKMN